jgi:transcriptional regulator with XRE-family HTH domain
VSHWRRLQRLTIDQVAERAGVSSATVQRIEKGADANFENVLRVGRALGLLNRIIDAFDPMETDVGRLRAYQTLPKRVRPRRE